MKRINRRFLSFTVGGSGTATLFFVFEELHWYILTCTNQTARSWWPAHPGRYLCCPRRESPPSAWPAPPAGPAAFGRWTGSPHAPHTAPQAAANCPPPSGLVRMCCHIPGPNAQRNKVTVEKTKAEPWRFEKAGLLMAATLWIIKHSCTQSHQLLHPSDCVVSMAQGVRQPIHSIASLAVPIETDGNASAAGTQKQGGDRALRRGD